MHVKIKSKDVQFSIPIPYAMLTIGISICGSRFFRKKANKWINNASNIPPINNKMLKPIIRELKNYKGMVLVEVKAQDGTEVKIKL